MFPPWVLLVPILAAAASAAACPGGCECGRFEGDGREVDCGLLKVTLNPENDELRVQCNTSGEATEESLELLRLVGAAKKVHLTFCPLPNLSALINGSAVETLVVENAQRSLILTPGHLEGLDRLSRLQLSADRIERLPDNIFEPLKNLTSLDLRENLLRSLPAFPETLTVLELGQNLLTQLPSNLPVLKRLNLWKNRVSALSPLQGLPKLTSLDLSGNGLASIATDAFASLPGLEELNLNKNRIKALPPGVLTTAKNLTNFRMNDNNATELHLPSAFLADLPVLKNVAIERSRLVVLPEDTFRGAKGLKTLSLISNRIESLPSGIFKDCSSLEKLDLSGNRLSEVPDFSGLTSLKHLLLARNKLVEVNAEVMRPLKALTHLDMSSNMLDVIFQQAFRANEKLHDVNMDNNFLTFSGGSRDAFGPYSAFHSNVELRTLSVRNNSIMEIPADWRITLVHLHSLDLRDNQLTSISAEELHFISGNLIVDMRENKISYGDLSIIQIIADNNNPSPNRSVLVKMDGSSFDCNHCETYHWLKLIEKRYPADVYKMLNVEISMTNSCLSALDSKTFLCPMPFRNVKCLDKCTCLFNPETKGIHMNCTTMLPTPGNDTNNFYRMRLNEINFVNADLTGNFSLVQLKPSRLRLDNNQLTSIDTIPANLTELRLNNNNLHRLSDTILTQLNHTDQLTLANNPWICDCDAVELMTFVQRRFSAIADLANITCQDGRTFVKLSADELCNSAQVAVAASVAVAVTGIILGVIAALYYKFQHEIKVWLYAHNLLLWLVTEAEVDKSKKYDGFVSYSHKDELFVAQTLVPGLEPPFKLCLHARDWNAGDWIPDQIARSVEDSRRTIVVLSPNYLESVWGRMEFRAAHQQAMSEGRARVLVILLEDVGPLDKLDPELRAYLTMNTYVKWGDPWFWDKLRYAMPHRKLKGEGRKRPRPLAIKINDKLEQLQNGV